MELSLQSPIKQLALLTVLAASSYSAFPQVSGDVTGGSTETPASTTTDIESAEAADDSFGNGKSSQILFRLITEALYSSNFFYEPVGGKQVTGLSLNPTIKSDFARQNIRAELEAGVKGAIFTFGRRDNFVDGDVGAGLSWTLAHQQKLDFHTQYQHGHDPFGQERTEDPTLIVENIDQWDHYSFDLGYRKFAAVGHGLEWKLGGEGAKRAYTNNRDDTRYIDYHRLGANANIAWRFSPKLAALTEYRRIWSNIDETRPSARDRSGVTDIQMLGITWRASSKTSGDVRIGRARRANNNVSSTDFNSGYWAVHVAWTPLNRTRFDLSTGRRFSESYVSSADFIDATVTSLRWTENWNTRLQSTASVTYGERDFVNAFRTDKVSRGRLRINYRVGALLSVYGSLQASSRESGNRNLEYERALAVIGFETALN